MLLGRDWEEAGGGEAKERVRPSPSDRPCWCYRVG